MPAGRILIFLAFCAMFPAMTFAQGRPAPSAETVEHLRRHHSNGDWWRITTDSARRGHVSAIDGEGIAESRPRTRPRHARSHLLNRSCIDKPVPRRAMIRGLLGFPRGARQRQQRCESRRSRRGPAAAARAPA